MRCPRRRFGTIALAFPVYLVAMPASGAMAQSTVIVEPSPLGEALRAVASSTGRSIYFAAETVAGLRVSRKIVKGTPEQMLRQLLVNTGLAIKPIGRSGFVVVRKQVPNATKYETPTAVNTADIVVTATRQPTLLSDTPVSMAVVTATELDRRNATDLGKVAAQIPGLAVTDLGSGLQRLSIRGVNAPGEPTVGLYYGDVPVAGPSGSSSDPSLMTPDLALIDVERVEVLKGPQGTLYGGGSLSGTVRVLFRQPEVGRVDASLSTRAVATGGGDPGGMISAMVNVPIRSGSVAIRSVAYVERNGGVIDNPTLRLSNIGGQTREGLRLAALWDAGGGWSVTLSGMAQRKIVDDSSNELAGNANYIVNRQVRVPYRDDFWLISNSIHGNVGGQTTLDITMARSQWSPHRSFDFTPVLTSAINDPASCDRVKGTICSPTQAARFDSYLDSQMPSLLDQPLSVRVDSFEVRLSGREPLVWTGGLFISHRQDRGSSRAMPVDQSSGLIIDGVPPTLSRSFSSSLRQAAAYVDGTIRIGPKVSLFGGGRYFNYQRSASNAVEITDPLTGLGPGAGYGMNYRAEGVVGRAGVEIRLKTGLLIYGQVSGGFRPGGINVVPGIDPGIAAYKDDRLTSYELGTKIITDHEQLTVSGAMFLQNWSEMKYSSITRIGGYSIISNLGSARITGLESEVKWAINAMFTARVAASYADARLTSDQVASDVVAPGRKGDRLPNAAPLSLAGSLSSKWHLPKDRTLLANANVSYVSHSSSTFEASDPDHLTMGGYAMIDLGLSLSKGGTTIALNVDNLTGQDAPVWALGGVFGSQIQRPRPRSVSIAFTTRL